jgi:hypothetical protein
MQDASQYNNTKINYTDATIQPNDILKVTIGALIPETAIPYNKITANPDQFGTNPNGPTEIPRPWQNFTLGIPSIRTGIKSA